MRVITKPVKLKEKQFTVDIEVNGSHTYQLGNGMVTHNTASIILGSGASGIHPNHSDRYIRRVQCNEQEMPLQFFKMYNPTAVTKSVWDSNGVTEVVSFPCEVPKGARTKKDVGAIQLLDDVKSTWTHWVNEGKNEHLCVEKTASHNVSNTISVGDDEWDMVEEYIYNNRSFFGGVSLLSKSGDKDYDQAPFQEVSTPKELVKQYGEAVLFASGVIVHAQNTFTSLYDACSCLLGMGEVLDETINININDVSKAKDSLHKLIDKKAWIERAKKFAKNYFDGNLKEMTYCLKDVDILKQYTDLSKVFEPIPWEKFIEVTDTTKIDNSPGAACSGNSCEVTHI